MANLNKEQARAVSTVDGPCLVLAGPGSGKTFTLVERIRHMIEEENINPRSILVITFSKKAADEMKIRFDRVTGGSNYPVYFGTFHAVFYNIVRNYYNLAPDSVLTDNIKFQYVGRVLKKLSIDKDYNYKKNVIQAIAIHKLKVTSSTINEDDKSYLKQLFDTSEDIELFYRIYELYVSICNENKKIDFDDMLFMCRDILNNKDVLDEYRKIYQYFLVDEFQDINNIQYEILMSLAGDKRNIFAVGDDDQCIYGFRGSKPEYMQKFINDNVNCTVIDMYRNYRCAECIVNNAGKLILNNSNRIEKNQKASKPDKDKGMVMIKCFESDSLEAEYIIDIILGRNKTINYEYDKSTAIIYRTERCAALLYERLKLNGIKCIKAGIRITYYETDWIKDIITYLKIAIGNNEEELIYRILNRPDRCLNRDSDLSNVYEKIHGISEMTPYAAVVYILKVIGYETYYYDVQRKKKTSHKEAVFQINELLNKAKDYNSIREWINAIEILNDDGTDNGKEDDNVEGHDTKYRVYMLTAHASKGLEFDNVFIIGLQEGIFPHRRAHTKEQIEEERRLLYVAMTRAKENLFVLGRGEEKYGKRISSFIGELQ